MYTHVNYSLLNQTKQAFYKYIDYQSSGYGANPHHFCSLHCDC